MVESAPCSHKFYLCESRPVDVFYGNERVHFLGSYAKFIDRPSIYLPAEWLVRIRQVLGQSNIRSILNVGRLKVNGPAAEQTVSVLLIEIAGVGDKSGRGQRVTDNSRHLSPECFAGRFPAFLLDAQRLEQANTAVHLGLHVLQVRLDGLNLLNEQRVFFFVGRDTLLQLSNQNCRLFAAVLVHIGLLDEALELVTQRFNSLQHVGLLDLSSSPLDERTASDTGTVEFVEIVIRIVQVLGDHHFVNIVRNVWL